MMTTSILRGELRARCWGCWVTNPRGNSLLHSVISKILQVISPTNPTYWPTSPRKRPDILDIFVTKIPGTLHSLITNLHALCLDHSPILLSIDCQPLSNQHTPTTLHSHINWDNFHKSILQKASLKVRLKTNNDIDEAVNLFTNLNLYNVSSLLGREYAHLLL